ncbi:hypothetical protein L2E82_27833 [Cichorium intybus]|uniref:Uncharacterized protein n=1 Tax=Cichorium intybus TaxID=13427 RepID=A0ACB9CU59_CICIN|nr:hypothetical protein L2E82_27833 [Cichorium intybus]
MEHQKALSNALKDLRAKVPIDNVSLDTEKSINSLESLIAICSRQLDDNDVKLVKVCMVTCISLSMAFRAALKMESRLWFTGRSSWGNYFTSVRHALSYFILLQD